MMGGNPGEHLVHGWALSKAAKLASQVLLQRLPTPVCASLQPYVDVLRHISNQHVWHAYIVQACRGRRNASTLPPGPRNGPCAPDRADYGSILNVPGVKAVAAGQPYVGYDNGGLLPPGISAVYNGTGSPEPVFTPSQWAQLRNTSLNAAASRAVETYLARIAANTYPLPTVAAGVQVAVAQSSDALGGAEPDPVSGHERCCDHAAVAAVV
jgi:hypothetical protein